MATSGDTVTKRKGYIMRKLLIAFMIVFGSAGCSSTPATSPNSAGASEPPRLGLSPQILAQGECGLFLWNRTDSKTFLFFQKAGESAALFYEGDERNLTNTANEGDLFGQFYPRSFWSFPDGRTLRLSVVPGEALEGGQRISNGVISAQNTEGWDVRTPVAGVTACQS